MRAALYVRVSTAGQTVENQLRELRSVARRRGWKVADVYRDDGMSGSKGRDQLTGARSHAQGRHAGAGGYRRRMECGSTRPPTVLHLAQLVNDLQAIDGALYLHQQALDSTTPTGRAMLAMCSVFAEFEREQIRERTIAGMQRARAAGKRIGRPSLPSDTHAKVRVLARRGMSNRAIARAVGVSEASVRRSRKAA